jgi:hypothetical protein
MAKFTGETTNQTIFERTKNMAGFRAEPEL